MKNVQRTFSNFFFAQHKPVLRHYPSALDERTIIIPRAKQKLWHYLTRRLLTLDMTLGALDMTLGDLFVLLQRPTRSLEYIGRATHCTTISALSDGLN
jgi:hypothetical protein